jgi:glycosyltransferase involved in cell wall biosynthesis
MAPAAHSGGDVRRVLHVMRLPMGGLFRHVQDLVLGQQENGIAVGVVCAEPAPGDTVSAKRLAALEPHCGLGLHLLPMSRLPGIGDLVNIREVGVLTRWLKPDVVHGHGAKGGLLARLAPAPGATVRVYTPHGGSLHYDATSPQGFAYLAAERLMRARTGGIIFESEFSRAAYFHKIGRPGGLATVIHNGVSETEFEPVAPAESLADFLFIGELRMLKGISTLIEAASLMNRPVHLRIVGAGPDRARFEEMAKRVGAHVRMEFMGPMPARDAFRLAKAVVLPSWKESLPYVVLEAAAAGLPLIATRVGGIPEIFGPDAGRLVPPTDAAALSAAMELVLADPADAIAAAAGLRARVMAHFSAARMVESVGHFYARLSEARRAQLRAGRGSAADGVKPGFTGAGR